MGFYSQNELLMSIVIVFNKKVKLVSLCLDFVFIYLNHAPSSCFQPSTHQDNLMAI